MYSDSVSAKFMEGIASFVKAIMGNIANNARDQIIDTYNAHVLIAIIKSIFRILNTYVVIYCGGIHFMKNCKHGEWCMTTLRRGCHLYVVLWCLRW
jgi:hypothetical protein